MDRRDFVKLLSLAGLAAVCPVGLRSASADDKKYDGPFFISLHAGGGYDPTIVCDPKGGTPTADPNNPWTEDSVNHFLKDDIKTIKGFKVAPAKAKDGTSPLGYATFSDDVGGGDIRELYSSERFFTEYADKVLVINGLDTTTNSHDTGTRIMWSGMQDEGHPSLLALMAGFYSNGKDLPLAYMSNGGYDTTAGVVALSRSSSNGAVIKRVAYPNVINVENLGNEMDPPSNYVSNETQARILAAQAERMGALRKRENLPEVRDTMGQLLLARQGAGTLGALADELTKAPQASLPAVFPTEFGGLDDNIFGMRGFIEQIQIALLSFKAGVGVAANLSMGGFDTHGTHDQDQTQQMMRLLRGFDVVHRLIDSLGLTGKVYVVIGSDFGRTPFYNEGMGKDHWNVTSMIMSGPGIPVGKTIGASDDGQKPMRVDKKDVDQVLPDSDGNGLRIECHHVHRELRRVGGLEGSELDKQFGLPGEPLPLFA